MALHLSLVLIKQFILHSLEFSALNTNFLCPNYVNPKQKSEGCGNSVQRFVGDIRVVEIMGILQSSHFCGTRNQRRKYFSLRMKNNPPITVCDLCVEVQSRKRLNRLIKNGRTSAIKIKSCKFCACAVIY